VLGGAGFHDLLDQLLHQDTDLVLVGKSATNVAFVEKLTRKAPCSVMVLPSVRSAAYKRMLVTTDCSDDSARAMEVAVAFAKARKLKQLHCFHGYQIAQGYHKTGLPLGRLGQEMEAWAQGRYREFLERSTSADSRPPSPARRVPGGAWHSQAGQRPAE